LERNGGKIQDYDGLDKFKNPPPPLVAIPTTAGTGSEVSISANVTDEATSYKMSVRHKFNVAKVAILDPAVLKTLPREMAAAPGADALNHAVEAYVSLWANPLSDAIASKAIEMISKNIRPFVANRANLDAGEKMLIGACMAGIAFTAVRVGNSHAMARALGGYNHVTHGVACAITLPYVMEFNLIANSIKYKEIARMMGENIEGLSDLEAAKKSNEAVKKMNKDIGIPERLRDVGVKEETIPDMASYSINLDYNRWNPRHTTYEDFVKLFKDAM